VSGKYILEGTEAVEVGDLITWAKWFETAQRHVGDTYFHLDGHEIRVSTVFLGLDHAFGDRSPQLFETMVFGDESWHELASNRYATWQEAFDGHYDICMQVADALNQRRIGNANLRRLSPGLPGE
jgi:hypothetical protein